MIYEKCRLVYLDASRNYFELFTWLYMTKIYIDSIYVVSASASEDSTNLPGGVSRLFGTCVASWVCIQITTPRFHCRVIARCAFLTESLKKVSRLERRRLVCAFPRRRDLAYFMDDVFTILYFKTHHCVWECNLLSFSWAQTHNNIWLQWLAKKDVQRSSAIFPTDRTDCSGHLDLQHPAWSAVIVLLLVHFFISCGSVSILKIYSWFTLGP